MTIYHTYVTLTYALIGSHVQLSNINNQYIMNLQIRLADEKAELHSLVDFQQLLLLIERGKYMASVSRFNRNVVNVLAEGPHPVQSGCKEFRLWITEKEGVVGNECAVYTELPKVDCNFCLALKLRTDLSKRSSLDNLTTTVLRNLPQ